MSEPGRHGFMGGPCLVLLRHGQSEWNAAGSGPGRPAAACLDGPYMGCW